MTNLIHRDMRRFIEVLLVMVAVVFLFSACEKDDEDLSQANKIEGQLTANENMTADDFGELGVSLIRLHDGVDPKSVNAETDAFDFIETVAVNPDGLFTFSDLPNGNYMIALTEGFVFPDEGLVSFSLTGGMVAELDKSVDRVPEENGTKTYDVKYTNRIGYDVTKLIFYYGETPYETVLASDLSDGHFSITLDKSKDVSFRLEYKKDGEIMVSSPLGFFFGESSDPQVVVLKYYNFESREYIKKGWFFGHYINLSINF